jgi:dipeptidyl aminopeptidase/acylaminoacyl peptidase
MERSAVLCACLLLLAAPAVVFAEGKRPFKIDDLFHFKRLSDPQVSPDGKLVVYVVGTVDLNENKSSSSLWIAPSNGKNRPWPLTNTTRKDRHPRWSPDGKHILFESNRSGDNQLWVIALEGGEARQLSHISSEASIGTWSPDGKHIAFVSAVYPEYSHRPFKESDAENKKRKEEKEKSPVKARIHTRLFYRHWDSYVEDKRQHLFVMPASGGGPRDVTPGDRDAYPTSTTFSLGDDFTFSPDGSHLLFTAVPERDEAWSTNHDICCVPIEGGKVETLTDNTAADASPRFSPDGKHLVYRAQKRAGYEADRWQLMLVETDPSGAFKGKPRSLTEDFDASVHEYVWDAGSGTVLFIAEQNARAPIFAVSTEGGKVRRLSGETTNLALSCGGRAGSELVASLRASMTQPPEVFAGAVAADSKSDELPLLQDENLSHANTKLLDELDMPRPQSVQVKVEGGQMQMWVLKPPGFDEHKKWPLVYLVHGGPQGAWEDGWSFRWNPSLWAGQGYVVALPNPRGSTSFGQKFVDEISGDWGGKCFDDLMKGMDALEKLPYIDRERMAAAGASFGGYMMNWFQGNTTRFKTLITHCGVYNFDSMYAMTDELWFDEWEHGGPPWGPNRASYEKHSPHRRARHFKTPMLIIHNDLDFRVPVSEGQQLFTTLQRLGIPSKFINFPDEGHWVLKPKNSELWHKEVFAWLAKYVPPGGR